MVQKADKATQERLAKLEKELQIEKESSQAAMLALKKELDVEKESSKAALKQVLTLCVWPCTVGALPLGCNGPVTTVQEAMGKSCLPVSANASCHCWLKHHLTHRICTTCTD